MFKKIKNISIMVIAVALIAFVALGPVRNSFFPGDGNCTSLEVKTFKQKYEASPNAVLLDVRTPEEVAETKIEGSVNIDYDGDNFHQELDKLDQNKEYFVYCESGGRSGKACAYLTDKGYKVYSLKGGIEAWNEDKQ